MSETLQKIIRGPAAAPAKRPTGPTLDQVRTGLEAMSEDARATVMTKAVFALGPSAQTLHKVTGGITPMPLNPTPIAPPQMAPLKSVPFTEKDVATYLASMDQDSRVKLIIEATLIAGRKKF
jgi:hypothetical protein